MEPPDQPRILRIFRARLTPGREPEWVRIVDRAISEQLARGQGLLECFIARPDAEDEGEYVIVSVWRDKDAVRAFVGASTVPIFVDNERELIEWSELKQYEIV